MASSPDPALGGPPQLATTLAAFWNKTVAELATVTVRELRPEEKERHRIFALLTFAVVFNNFNGNSRGQYGTYPLRSKQLLKNGTYRGDQYGDRYLGHNIACIAVDGHGKVIDFEMNHNDLFDSSVEHGESRLIRRIFSLAQRYERLPPAEEGPKHQFSLKNADHLQTGNPYYTILDQVTVYTSLETCAQCAGIMALAQAKELVYLQSDPGQARIAEILYNLSQGKIAAPMPIQASHFDFEYAAELNQAYATYCQEVAANPDGYYFCPPRHGKKAPDPKSYERGNSLTSFLCTDMAYDIFARARDEFLVLEPAHPGYQPADPNAGPAPSVVNPSVVNPSVVKTNEQALQYARRFSEYVSSAGRRGTPHRV